MNTNELKAEMKRNADRQSDLAKVLGCSLSSLNAKINGKRRAEFTQSEIKAIMRRYGLSADSLVTIFFADSVSR